MSRPSSAKHEIRTIRRMISFSFLCFLILSYVRIYIQQDLHGHAIDADRLPNHPDSMHLDGTPSALLRRTPPRCISPSPRLTRPNTPSPRVYNTNLTTANTNDNDSGSKQNNSNLSNTNNDNNNKKKATTDAANEKKKERKKNEPRKRRRANEIERKFPCEVPNCGKSYGNEGSLKTHMRQKHPGCLVRTTGSPLSMINMRQLGGYPPYLPILPGQVFPTQFPLNVSSSSG